MVYDFEQLNVLLECDPSAYRQEVRRMKEEDPARFEQYIQHMRQDLARAHEAEDRPLTEAEIDGLVDNTAEAMGWTVRRTLAEAILRLRRDSLYSNDQFVPVTPSEDLEHRRNRYMRRHSSIRALVLGDVKAAVAAHESMLKAIKPRRDSDPPTTLHVVRDIPPKK